MAMDKLTATGVIFFLLNLVAFLIVFGVQYRNITPESQKATALITRIAMFLPLYSLFMLVSVGDPNSLAGMSIPTAIVEGYSFYAFLSLLVSNMGGPSQVVQQMQGRPLFCCVSLCPSESDRFYNKTVWALFQFVVFRPIVVLIAAICFYSKTKAGRLLYLLFTLVALAILIRSLLHFVLLCKNFSIFSFHSKKLIFIFICFFFR
jgi:4-amino-4-deoxy-L-arabinose transferase-like glycosyltransferase